MTNRLLAGWIVALGIGSGAVLAHEGHVHPVMGTVVMAAPDHVMLKTSEGKEVTMTVTEKTKILKGSATVTIEELKAGTRVVATPVSEKEPLLAATIRIGTAAKPAAAVSKK